MKHINFDFDQNTGDIVVEIDGVEYEGQLTKLAKKQTISHVVGQIKAAAYLGLGNTDDELRKVAPYVSEWTRCKFISASSPSGKNLKYSVADLDMFKTSVKGKELMNQVLNRSRKSN